MDTKELEARCAELTAYLNQFACEQCGTMGITEEGMDIFIASLCPKCFAELWKGYLEAVSEREVSDEEARAYLGDDYPCV